MALSAIIALGCFWRKRRCAENNDVEDNKGTPLMTLDPSSETVKNFAPIPVKDFLDGSVSLQRKDEFDAINANDKKRVNEQTFQATLMKNKGKNVNKEIVPYDYNRVKVNLLKTDTDYINASWIRFSCDKYSK